MANEEDFAEHLDVGEAVVFPGFPEWYDRNGERPILRTGTIVSDPRFDYRMNAEPPRIGDGNDQMAFEAFSLSGNSGSPVFVLQRGMRPGNGLIYDGKAHSLMLVGINAGHMRHAGEHSGLSYLYKSTAILQLLEMLDWEAKSVVQQGN